MSSNDNNNYKILIGLADTDNHKKYNCIRFKEINQDLYVLMPFEYKDQMKDFCTAENIWGSWSSSERAWKYPINAKSKIFIELEKLFKADPKQKDYVNFNATNQPAETNNNLSAKTESIKQTINPAQIQPPKREPLPTVPPKPSVISDSELAQQEQDVLQPEIVEPEDYPQLSDNPNQLNTNTNPFAIQPAKSGLLELTASVDDIIERWNQFRKLDTLLLDESDYQETGSGKNKKKFKKKSAFRKYATAYGINCKRIGKPQIDEKIDSETQRPLEYIVHYYVIAFPFNNPNHYQDGEGVADGREKCQYEDKEYFDKTVQPWVKKIKHKCPPDCDWRRHWSHWRHDIKTLAHTRAKNRAISDLVGSGEVSFEEMESPNADE
jgi:hypothetical protein